MDRSVQPEILDQLPQGHPDALRNRREIRLINHWMGNFRWFSNRAAQLIHKKDRIIELGAGCGELAAVIRQRLSHHHLHPTYTGLDLWSRPKQWPGDCDWIQQDLLNFDGYADYTCWIGNLILHQFEAAQLRQLVAKITPKTRLLLLNEPLRLQRNLKLYRWCSRFLLSPVSQHDGAVSIAAGFIPGELPELLGLSVNDWHIREHTTLSGAYRLSAVRK